MLLPPGCPRSVDLLDEKVKVPAIPQGVVLWLQTTGAQWPYLIAITVMILSFPTNRSWQTVQTQLRLLLEEQSDQGLHCLLFHLHLFDKIPLCLNFRYITKFLASENLGALG